MRYESHVHRLNEQLKRWIIEQVGSHPRNIAKVAAKQFDVSRQAVNRHLNQLVREGLLCASGRTRARHYELVCLVEYANIRPLTERPAEDVIWRQEIAPHLQDLPPNVRSICQWAFTEMFNNAVEHSAGEHVHFRIRRTAAAIELAVIDDGIGIFRKIQERFKLEDARHAILELSKGKLTTDSRHHSGEGIFFASRMVDRFWISSDHLTFHHVGEHDWLVESEPVGRQGTWVNMQVNPCTTRTVQAVIDGFTAEYGQYGFTRTHVFADLARYGDEQLISRSQAKRLLHRFEKFKEIYLDFEGVPTIGQAFADEVFRVFPADHPHAKIIPTRASPEIDGMIKHVMAQDETFHLPGLQPDDDSGAGTTGMGWTGKERVTA